MLLLQPTASNNAPQPISRQDGFKYLCIIFSSKKGLRFVLSGLRDTHSAATRRRFWHDVADIKGFRLSGATNGSVRSEALNAFHIEALPSLAVRFVVWYLNRALARRLGRRSLMSACARETAMGGRCRSSGLLYTSSLKRLALLLDSRFIGWGIYRLGISSKSLRYHVRVVHLPLIINPTEHHSGYCG